MSVSHTVPCPKCDYPLTEKTALQCSECGSHIPAGYVDDPTNAHLLPHERNQSFGWLRTISFALLRPDLFCRQLGKRTARPIRSPVWLLLAFALATLFVHAVSLLLDALRVTLQLSPEGAARVLSLTWQDSVHMAMQHTVVLLFSGWVLAGVLASAYRKRLDAYRIVDLAAVLSAPAVVGAVLFQLPSLAPRGWVGEATQVAVNGQVVVLWVWLGFLCRRTLSLPLVPTLGMLLFGMGLLWGIAMFVTMSWPMV